MYHLASAQMFLTKDRGWGVRGKATIPKGAFIVEYAGKSYDSILSPRMTLTCGPAVMPRWCFLVGCIILYYNRGRTW